MTPELAVAIAILLCVFALGVLAGIAYMIKKGYNETPLVRVGWCVIDDDDAILGYAKAPEDYADIMRGKDYATAHPMFIKSID